VKEGAKVVVVAEVAVTLQKLQVQLQAPRLARLAMATLLPSPLLPPVLILAPTLLLLLLRMAPLPPFDWMVSLVRAWAAALV